MTLIPELQKDLSLSENAISAWKFTEEFIYLCSLNLAIVITHISLDKRPRCLYYFFLTFGVKAFAAILKLRFHQPRPVWENSDIEALSCSERYGNPSGHSIAATAVVFGVWLDFNERVQENPDNLLRPWYWRLLFLIAALAIPCFVGYSMLVFGNHSLDQVLFSSMLGAWFALTTHFLLRVFLIKLAKDLITVTETRLMRIALVATGLHLIIIGI